MGLKFKNIPIRGTKVHQCVIQDDFSLFQEESHKLLKTLNQVKKLKNKQKPRKKIIYTLFHIIISDNNILLRTAAEKGHTQFLLYFLNVGANPAAVDNYALKRAAEKGHFEIVRILLSDKRVNPRAENNFAYKICKNTFPEIASFIHMMLK